MSEDTPQENGEIVSEFTNTSSPDAIARICALSTPAADKHGKSLIRIKTKKVPAGVLPEGYNGIIHTPSAASCNERGLVKGRGRGRGVDDHTYKNHPKLQRQLPRCYSILRLFRTSDGKCVGKHVLQGYYKFGGTAADEDSHVHTKSLSQNTDKATRIVLSEKANGKAAVITMFKFGGDVYVFGGSKGEHILVRMKNYERDLSNYDPGHYAYEILFSFFNVWKSMAKESRAILQKTLIGSPSTVDDTTSEEEVDEAKVAEDVTQETGERSKSSCADGCTLCCEYEDGKHMVPLPIVGKEMIDPILKAFGLIENRGEIDEGETLCSDVVPTLEFIRKLGLPVIAYEIKTPEEVRKMKVNLRTGKMKEGYVLHYQMQNENGEYVTLAVEKYKLWWYIVLRVIREFLSNAHIQGNIWKKKLTDRLKKRNRDFMNMPPHLLKAWIDLSIAFSAWFIKSKRKKNVLGCFQECKGMGFVWNQFMALHPHLNDNFKLNESGEIIVVDESKVDKVIVDFDDEFDDGKDEDAAPSAAPDAAPDGVLVVFQGMPGIGKSYITSALIEAMKAYKIPSIGLEQDPFAARFGKKKAGRKCVQQFTKYIKGGRHKVVFLQRNNATFDQFQKYANEAHAFNWHVHVITPRNILDQPLIGFASMQSVHQRSFKKDHPTFKSIPLEDQFKISLIFLGLFRKITEGGLVQNVDEIDMVHSFEEFDEETPEMAIKYFYDYLEHVKKGRFKATSYDAQKVVDGMMLESIDYQKYRRTPEEIARDVVVAVISRSFKRPVDKVDE